MNQMCRVCGEPAAGFHFGAFTCEGCKSFFGRTYSNHAALGECKNKGQCVINKKNRTSCKSCRLKKCYTVGMSKSGSRYGRRSNWFKIHCLIQNQAEMNNSLTDGNGLNGQLSQSFNENKNLLSQYKTERDTNSCSSAPNLPSHGASPNSSESSTRTLSSPYSSLFEAAKASGFTHRYNPSSPSISEKQTNKLINGNHCYPGPSLPLSPVSPLSPLNPASRFFFQSAASLFGNSAPKLLNTELGYLSTYSSRFLPLQSLNPVLKQSIIKEQSIKNPYEFYANEVPEQDCPIDLSLKTSSSSIRLSSCEKEDLLSSKQIIRDHDSGFSPSSNEENNNTSPLDLTSKKSPEPKIESEDRNESSSVSEEKKCPELNQNDNKAKSVVST